MHPEIPKPVRRQLNSIAGQAHELALRKELTKLAGEVDRWRRGEIDTFQLEERIHKFHDGASREIYNQFSDRRNWRLPLLVAHAVVNGLVDEKDVPPEVVPYVEKQVQFYRGERAEDS